MTTTTDLQNSLAAKLNEIDTLEADVSNLKSSIADSNLSQLSARVSTLETKTNELNADIQALQGLFNTDHYEHLPKLSQSVISNTNSIDDLTVKVNQILNVLSSVQQALNNK